MGETFWAFLKAGWPLLLMIGVVNLLGWLQRKPGKVRPAAGCCGVCRTPGPGLRKPATLHEALWGGWTCAGCGATVNAHGEPIEGTPPRAPSRPLAGPVSNLFRRRPGLVMGLFWGLAMWLAVSLAPEVFALLRGDAFDAAKVLTGLLLWGGGGGFLFGWFMRMAELRKPKS